MVGYYIYIYIYNRNTYNVNYIKKKIDIDNNIYLICSPDELKATAKENNEPPPEFKVSAQFMELYNEEILDLLSPSGENKNKKSNLKVNSSCFD